MNHSTLTHVTANHKRQAAAHYACSECEFTTDDDDDLVEVSNFSVRVAAGEICPAGECPECGALVHLINQKTEAMAHAMEMLGELNANLSAWEDEEESVKEEHAELIATLRALINKVEAVAA